jgi:hypothetical protein
VTSLQEQYVETIKQGQEVLAGAAASWTRTIQDAWGQFPVTDPYEAVDRFYATTGRLLEVQRDVAKGLMHTASTFAETFRADTRKATEAPQSEG